MGCNYVRDGHGGETKGVRVFKSWFDVRAVNLTRGRAAQMNGLIRLFTALWKQGDVPHAHSKKFRAKEGTEKPVWEQRRGCDSQCSVKRLGILHVFRAQCLQWVEPFRDHMEVDWADRQSHSMQADPFPVPPVELAGGSFDKCRR